MAEDLPEEVNKRQRRNQLAIGGSRQNLQGLLSNQSKALSIPALNFTADTNQSNDSVPGRLLRVYKERQVRTLSFGVGLARNWLWLGEP